MQLNHTLAVQKFMGAAALIGERRDGGTVLRPSSCGNCPARLWYAQRDAELGIRRPPGDPVRAWRALQGNYNEALIIHLLQMAGAQVLHGPSEDELKWIPEQVGYLGSPPHIDAAIYWPEVGITEWCILELKDPRVNAHLKHLLVGLWSDRTYAFQAVDYLMESAIALENYSTVSAEWYELWEQYPEGLPGLVFCSTAKDPSTAAMMLGAQIKPAKYEENPSKMKPEQHLRAAEKAAKRLRFEELGQVVDVYLELIEKTEPDVQDAWSQIQALPTMLMLPEPQRLHDPTLPDEEQEDECRWYCDVAERCREDLLKTQLERSVQDGSERGAVGTGAAAE